MNLSSIQRRCVIQATIAPLRRYPKGYGRPDDGVFFKNETVRPLIRSGYLRVTGHFVTAISDS